METETEIDRQIELSFINLRSPIYDSGFSRFFLFSTDGVIDGGNLKELS